MLDYCHKALGVGWIKLKHFKTHVTKNVYYWEVWSNDASKVLELLLPFLIVKASRAKHAIEFQHKLAPLRFKQYLDRSWASDYCNLVREANYKIGSSKAFTPCTKIWTKPTGERLIL